MDTSSGNVESKSPVSEIEVKPEKIEDIHQGPSFTCDLCDKELTYKIAQDLLSGLATACVDGTTGVLFKTPASVADEFRKEMVGYLSVRSESFVAETVVLETDPGAEVSDHPLDILSNMIDDFAVSKRSLFSRVSGMMLSEMREDRIDEFGQEMERDSFWLLDKRESVAQALIKNVDFKSLYHCNMKFSSEEEVIEHQKTCGYRAVMCENEGCNDTFSADSVEHHDSICPFKILPCEQNCSELLMRRDMDKHCITDCPMKLTNCPFYSIGCQSPVSNSLIKKHCSENTHGHLLHVLQYIHREASIEDAERWAEQIEKSQFADQLEARDVRTFTMAVKDIEKRIGPFEVTQKRSETTEDAPALPLQQAITAPEQPTKTPPTDQVAAPPPKEQDMPQDLAPPSKERDTPSVSPEQDLAPPSKEREAPSLSPEQDLAPAPITTQNDADTTPPHQAPASSPASSTQEETETIPTQQAVITPEEVTAAFPPDHAFSLDSATPNLQEPSPSTDNPELATSPEVAKTAPPQQTEN